MTAGVIPADLSGGRIHQPKEVPSMIPQAKARRRLGWLGAGMFTVAALLGPAIGHAAAVEPGTTLHQDPPINWDATGYTDEDCPDLQAGQVAWHFVLTSTTDANTMTLYTEFDTAGSLQTVSTKQSGPVLHWYVFTGRDTLLGAWTDAIGDNLNLSHICVGPDETTSTSTTTETTTPHTTTY
jgi:hypothetical protein